MSLDAARTAVAVTYLADDPDARRALLAWPQLDHALPERALLAAWSLACGVPRTQLRRLAGVLRTQGLCRNDGSIDPAAQQVVAHIAAERLRGGRGARR